MTQQQQILKHLRTRGCITTFIAFKQYRVTRLAQRIAEIERDGHLINRAWVSRNGKRYVAYSLVEGKRKAA